MTKMNENHGTVECGVDLTLDEPFELFVEVSTCAAPLSAFSGFGCFTGGLVGNLAAAAEGATGIALRTVSRGTTKLFGGILFNTVETSVAFVCGVLATDFITVVVLTETVFIGCVEMVCLFGGMVIETVDLSDVDCTGVFVTDFSALLATVGSFIVAKLRFNVDGIAAFAEDLSRLPLILAAGASCKDVAARLFTRPCPIGKTFDTS
jgi:hypothetical protein